MHFKAWLKRQKNEWDAARIALTVLGFIISALGAALIYVSRLDTWLPEWVRFIPSSVGIVAVWFGLVCIFKLHKVL